MRALKDFRLPLLLIPVSFLASLAAPGATPEALLPVQIGSWQQTEWQQVEATELERVASTRAALLREYGCRRAEQARYQRGAADWRATVYEMVDRSSAYGAFTLLGAGGSRLAVGEAGSQQGNDLTFYQSNYYVHMEGAPGAAELARHLAAQAGPQASLPTLPGYLPREGFIQRSDRYLLGPLALAEVAPLAPGDWAGFAYGAEAEAGRYRLGRGEATLLIFSYPTPQIAADRLRDFERLFNLNGAGDPTRLPAFAKRSGTLVVFVSGVASGEDAAKLLNQVRYEAEISWSELSDPRPPPNWALTLLNLFIGTGLFVAYALFAGLAFAGVRLLVTRLFPGKVFDRPEDTEIIQLNLGAKS